MKIPRLIGRANPAESAMADVQRLQTQREKLDARLTAAVARVEAAQADRRCALVESDPGATEMAKLDRACNEAAEARAGVEEAARHVATQLEDAQRRYQSLVDEARRAEVIVNCEARADRLDAAAERLRGAAESLSNARLDFIGAIEADGIAGEHLEAGYSAEALAGPIIRQALRTAEGTIVGPSCFGALMPSNDVLIETRRAQSGRLRDVADAFRDGASPVVEPARPGAIEVPYVPPPAAPAVRVILSRGIQFGSVEGGTQFGFTGGADLPPEIAAVVLESGIGFEDGSHEGKKILAALANKPMNMPLKRTSDGVWIADRGAPEPDSRTGKSVMPEAFLWIDVPGRQDVAA